MFLDFPQITLYALIPALLLIFYICYRDRVQSEPPYLIILGFIAGIMVTYPAAYLNTYHNFGETPALNALTPAIWEEGLKMLAICILLWRNKHFDEHLDGIVYAVCVGVGFEFYENLFYFMQGADVLARTSTPGHMLFAIPMGYFLSKAHFDKKWRFLYLPCAFIVPSSLHWFWDFCCFYAESNPSAGELIGLILTVFIIVLFIATNKLIEQQQRKDKVANAEALALRNGEVFDKESFIKSLAKPKKDRGNAGISIVYSAIICALATIFMVIGIVVGPLSDWKFYSPLAVAILEGASFVWIITNLKKNGRITKALEYLTYAFAGLGVIVNLLSESSFVSILYTASFVFWGFFIIRKYSGALKMYAISYFATLFVSMIISTFTNSPYADLVCLIQYPFLWLAMTENKKDEITETVQQIVPEPKKNESFVSKVKGMNVQVWGILALCICCVVTSTLGNNSKSDDSEDFDWMSLFEEEDISQDAKYIEKTPGVAVDLGLPSGLKWSSSNLGAESVFDDGDLYRWGETEPSNKEKEISDYKFFLSSHVLDCAERIAEVYDFFDIRDTTVVDTTILVKFSKYIISTCSNSIWKKPTLSWEPVGTTTYLFSGIQDNKKDLESEDDAAVATLGSEWHMPTGTEFGELFSYCKFGVDGDGHHLFLGPNGNAIYIEKEIWSANLSSNGTAYAYTNNPRNPRTARLSIRPVMAGEPQTEEFPSQSFRSQDIPQQALM